MSSSAVVANSNFLASKDSIGGTELARGEVGHSDWTSTKQVSVLVALYVRSHMARLALVPLLRSPTKLQPSLAAVANCACKLASHAEVWQPGKQLRFG